MKKLLILIAAFSIFFPHASAAEEWPLPSEPTWWKTSGLEGVRYGQWLPCDVALKSTNDCIESVTLSKIDGSLTGKATYLSNGNFNPDKAVQKWDQYLDSDGTMKDNASYFVDEMVGNWVMPEGFKSSDGSNWFLAHVHLMNGNLQTTITANGSAAGRASLPTDTYFEVGFRSKNMKKYIGWIMSSVKDPQVRFDGEVIYVKGIPSNSPWMSGINNKVCDSNSEKATSTAAGITIMLFFNTRLANNIADPGDLILGTNGWWCINGVVFDRNTQELVAKVGTAHFDEVGKVVDGWLELKVKGQRAKQWWGMEPSVAVGFAKVSITYEDGTSSVATVSANYDKVNDWISLKAYGFHYSSPAVKMSFQNAKSNSVAAPTKVSASKKITITCIKGKTKKTVSGFNPKCPSGYKKAA